jgi:hypothetical protein
MDQDDLVYYDGRLMPLSRASAFAAEDANRHHSEPNLPKNTPATEWDHQKLDQLFKAFYKGIDAATTEQKTRQDAEIAEQKAKQDAENARQDAEIARFASWGFVGPIDLAHLPEGVFTFDQALSPDQDWCRYTREKWLKKFLRKFGYPEDFIAKRVIPRAGYEKLIAEEQKTLRAYKTAWEEDNRKKQAALANQVPEPNEQREANKSKASKQKI